MDESRLCIRMTEDRSSFNFLRQNVSILDAREICQRIALFIRNHQSGVPQTNQIIDAWEAWDLEEESKVCIVWNPETRQIRFSVSGLDLWDTAVACDHAAMYFNALLINPAEIQENTNGGADNR